MKFKNFTFDAQTKNIFQKSKFAATKAQEKQFERSLRKIAKATGNIIEAFTVGATITDPKAMMKILNDYSKLLTPWAKLQSQKLLGETLKRINSDKLYKEQSKKMGSLISKEINETETGFLTMNLMNEQVELIKSIPLEAGERAQKLAIENLSGSRRAEEIAAELRKTTKVTENRAVLIARTETARANTYLNLARATSIGSKKYIWRTSGDADVRESHKKMNGKEFFWNKPPTLEDGMTGHPGTFPNCRCYAEPILEDE